MAVPIWQQWALKDYISHQCHFLASFPVWMWYGHSSSYVNLTPFWCPATLIRSFWLVLTTQLCCGAIGYDTIAEFNVDSKAEYTA